MGANSGAHGGVGLENGHPPPQPPINVIFSSPCACLQGGRMLRIDPPHHDASRRCSLKPGTSSRWHHEPPPPPFAPAPSTPLVTRHHHKNPQDGSGRDSPPSCIAAQGLGAVEEEETKEGGEKSGNRGPPGTRQVVLPLAMTDGEAPWRGAGGGALCAGLVPRPPRQATGATTGDAPKVCKAYLVPLLQGAAVRKGRHCAWRAPESVGEGDGREASGGAGGHLERPPRATTRPKRTPRG